MKLVLGNGLLTKFWKDAWLFPGVFLKDYLLAELPENELILPVAHFVSEDGEWRCSLFNNLLPEFVIEFIIQHAPPGPSNVEDFRSWVASSDGSFSSRSAYSLLINESENQYSSYWKKFWTWCPICGRLEEVPFHALRNCICVKKSSCNFSQERNSKVFAEKYKQPYEVVNMIKSLIVEFNSSEIEATKLVVEVCSVMKRGPGSLVLLVDYMLNLPLRLNCMVYFMLYENSLGPWNEEGLL
ncbi:putative ribonuclease H protein [Sesbania bispinosa]|nr:putative ribonuclease H protein [Sesbania bispinosa]